MENKRQVYFNGVYIDEDKASFSIFDSAVMFGDCTFTMMRSFHKKVFKLREHLERLYNGIKILRIPITMTIEEMEEACYKTIKVNEHLFSATDEHRLMINVSRGILGIYAPVFDNKIEPTIIIADFPLKWTVVGMGDLYNTGINAVIPSQRAIPSDLLDPKIKNRSRLHYQMANIEVSDTKGNNNWALLLDPDGFIAEGTGDNFFIVKDNVVITPEGRNILRGISREYIFDICKSTKILCIEKNITPYDVYTADEAFMTGTPFSILPVTSLNGLKIGNGKMENVTQFLIDKWGDRVGLDLIAQIKMFNEECKLTVNASTPYSFKSQIK